MSSSIETFKQYDFVHEASSGFEGAINRYMDKRYADLTSNIDKSKVPGSPVLTLRDVLIFVQAIGQSLPVYLLEQNAPLASIYGSARGAVYNWISFRVVRGHPSAEENKTAIFLNHTFRAASNCIDSLIDDYKQIKSREDLRKLQETNPLASYTLIIQSHYYQTLRNLGRETRFNGENRNALGIAARRFQMNLSLALDWAIMVNRGIDQTKYFSGLPSTPTTFPFSREDAATLILLGLNAESVYADTVLPVDPNATLNSRWRDASFWAGVMGTLGDQWADVLQDYTEGSRNIFTSMAEDTNESSCVQKILNTMREQAQDLLKSPSIIDRLNFLRLQIATTRAFKRLSPEASSMFGGLINQAFLAIPAEFRDAFVPLRIACWDIVVLNQLADFLMHKDRMAELAKANAFRQ